MTTAKSGTSQSARPLVFRQQGASLAGLVVLLLPVVLLSLLPVLRLAVAGLTRNGALDVAAGLDVLAGRAAVLATLHSLETSLVSAALAVWAGASCAILMTLWKVPGRRSFAFLLVLSAMIAPQVAALAFASLLGPASPLLLTVGLAPEPGSPNPMRSAEGIIAVLALHHAPLAFVVVRAGVARIPRELVDAAQIDGATRLQTIGWVILPLVRSHLAGAALLCFAAALGNFGIPAILGLSSGYLTLPTLIYRRLSSFGPSVVGDVATLSLVLVALALGSVLAAHRLVSRSPAFPADGNTLHGLWLPGAGVRIAVASAWILIGVALVLPLASLLASSLVPSYGMALTPGSATVSHYAEVLLRQDVTVRAFRNSLVFSATAAMICAALAIVLGTILLRQWAALRGVLEAAVELPYAIPGVVLALAAILLLLRPLPVIGVSLYGTGTIIVLAYCARFLTLALKPVTASLDQLDRSVEEAAALCGAGFIQRLRYIVVPCTAPGIVAGALMVFLIAFNELTVSALLWSRGTETIGVVLFSFEEAGLASTAASIGVVATVVTACIMLILDRLAGLLPPSSLPWR